MDEQKLSTLQKALTINLNPSVYGSVAEIGAGQEVARSFFQAGAASGTIARSISAYDMTVSDTIYGKTPGQRYVCSERLSQMLGYEFENLNSILAGKNNLCFFSFANTVAALNFKKDNYCHGWMGIRFQLKPGGEYNQMVVHFRLWEKDNQSQQRTCGIVGINLIYAAFYLYSRPVAMLRSLMDETSKDQVTIDMLSACGPDLDYIDNRLLAVQLVKNNMSEAAMFDRNGNVMQADDMFYRKNVMILRGSFRPITYVGFDMLKTGYRMLKQDVEFTKTNTVALCEITMDNLLAEGNFDERNFLARADLLCGMGQNVLISNFREYYRLVLYMSQFKATNLRLLIGADTFTKVIRPEYYSGLKGGVLEAFGRLFQQNLKVFLYPALKGDVILHSGNIPVDSGMKCLYKFLIEAGKIIDIPDAKTDWLHIQPHEIRKLIGKADPRWEKMVPVYVAKYIKRHGESDFSE